MNDSEMTVYLDTLFGLCRDAFRGGHREALQFVSARLHGLIPPESVTAFLASLAADADAAKPAPLPPLPVTPEADGLADDSLAELVAAYVPPPAEQRPAYGQGWNDVSSKRTPPRPELTW